MINILVVDDEKVVRDLLSRLFVRDSVNILLAENGLQALEIAKTNEIDLAIMDIRMPGIDGLRTYQELRSIKPNLPCIFMTGYAVEEALLLKTKKPETVCLKKPFDDIQEIKDLVQETLEKKKLDEEKAMRDRRTYVRLSVTLDVSYRKVGDKGNFTPCLSKDIAPGGISLVVQEDIPIGTVLDLVIKATGSSEVCEANGAVVWAKKPEDHLSSLSIGVKFSNVDMSKLAKIVIAST